MCRYILFFNKLNLFVELNNMSKMAMLTFAGLAFIYLFVFHFFFSNPQITIDRFNFIFAGVFKFKKKLSR